MPPVAPVSLHRSTDSWWLLSLHGKLGFFIFSLIPCSASSEYPVYPTTSVWLSLRIVFCISMLCLMSSSGSQTCFFSTCFLHLGDSDLVSSNAFLLFHDFFLQSVPYIYICVCSGFCLYPLHWRVNAIPDELQPTHFNSATYLCY